MEQSSSVRLPTTIIANANGVEYSLYHEKQSMQLCLLHTLNCLFQRKEFTKSDLDCIAENLYSSSTNWFNPHRSPFGFGNYDVNVLIAALETRDFKVRWFDARQSSSIINTTKVFGYIFNVPSRNAYIPFLNSRHWFTVRQIADIGFFNFDSKLNEPEFIEDFVEFADRLLREGNQLMLVVQVENIHDIFLA